MAGLAELRRRRIHDLRLAPDRALETLEDAAAFLAERGMLTLTQDCALPSLFAACHEEPYKAGAKGFGSWPKTKYPWAFQLAERRDVFALKIHRGKTLLCTAEVARAVDPLARAALAEAGASADERAKLVRHLRAAGPSTIDDVKAELGFPPPTLRVIRERLETLGALVSREIEVPDAKGGHRHTSELRLWDQLWNKPWRATEEAALAELAVLGVRAALLTHEDEVAKWFSWPIEKGALAELVRAGRLARPGPGWLAGSHVSA
jgi:hypothetical protein